MATALAHPTSRRIALLVSALACAGTATVALPADAHTETASAEASISAVRVIRTTPFARSTTSLQDSEGTAYVRRDRTLWLVDDRGDRLLGINPRTGVLKRTIEFEELAAARKFRGQRRAGPARARDLEALAYDAAKDRLYAFSGADCVPSRKNCRIPSRPAAFRLDRLGGRLQLHSYQPLRRGSDHTAAAWNPQDKRLYVGSGTTLRRYVYTKNRQGPGHGLPGVTDLLGMDFTGHGRLLAVHNKTRLSKLRWRTGTPVWTVDLTGTGVRDGRGVEVIGRRLFVADGFDDRTTGDPLRYAVFVLRVAP